MQKFSFKKGMAFALAATTALSGLPASPTVAYAYTVNGSVTTLTATDIRVNADENNEGSSFIYDGEVKTPVLYFDKNANNTYDKNSDVVLTKEPSFKEALTATTIGSNINASTQASVTIPENLYTISDSSYRIESPITINYEIGVYDLSKATIKVNDTEISATSPITFDTKGTNLTLSGTKSNGSDNVVNIYIGDTPVKDITGLVLTNTGADNAVAGATYTITVTAGKDATNFKTGSSKSVNYTAIRNVLENAKVELYSGYEKRTYDGTEKIIGKSQVKTITLGDETLDKDAFKALGVTKVPYASILAYEKVKKDKGDLDSYAKGLGFESKDALESAYGYENGEPYLSTVKNAGTYYLVLEPNTKYSGYVEKSFVIEKLDVTNFTVTKTGIPSAKGIGIEAAEVANKIYTGSRIEPITKIYVHDGQKSYIFSTKAESAVDNDSNGTKDTASVKYDNNINAPQAVSEYVSKLAEVGLADTSTDGVVTLYNASGNGAQATISVTGAGASALRDYTSAKAAKSTIAGNATDWYAQVKKAVAEAEEYLPKAVLSFSGNDNFSGNVTIKSIFTIGQYSLNNAAVVGADGTPATSNIDTSSYKNTYSVDETVPLELGTNGIQFKIGSYVIPSDELTATYYSTDFDGYSGEWTFGESVAFDRIMLDASGNTKPKTQYVKMTVSPLKGNNNYVSGTSKDVFFITGKSLKSTASLVLDKTTAVFNGKQLDSFINTTGASGTSIKATVQGATADLRENTDYELSYYKDGKLVSSNAVAKAGTYTIQARGIAEYAGTITNVFTITQKDIAAQTTLPKYDVTVVGTSNTVDVASISGKTATIEYGTALKGASGFSGGVKDSTAKGYNLEFNKDYKLVFVDDSSTKEYAANQVTEVGTYSIYLEGDGSYTGRVDSTYDLIVGAQPLALNQISITPTVGNEISFGSSVGVGAAKIYYTGSAITPNLLGIKVLAADLKTPLIEGTDYNIEIKTSATDVGDSGVVAITCPATSRYSAAANITASFVVVAGDLSKDIYSVSLEEVENNIYEHAGTVTEGPKFVIKDTRTDKEITEVYSSSRVNYTYGYSYTTVGKEGGTLNIVGSKTSAPTPTAGYTGNYIGTKAVKFDTQASISKMHFGGIKDTLYDYDGTNHMPNVVVQDLEGNVLTDGTDYTVSIMNADETKTYEDIVNVLRTENKDAEGLLPLITAQNDYVQSYHVIYTGIGSYAGKKIFEIGIKPRSVKDKSVTITAENQKYTGDFLEPVVVTYENKTLTAGVDYTITYQNNKNVGTATYVLKGAGNFDDTFSVYENDKAQFEIEPTESTKVYTEEEVAKAIEDAVKEAIASGDASGNATIQKIINVAVEEAKAEATKGMISEEAAESAKNEAVQAAVAEATKDTISKTDSDAAIAAAVAEATKDTISKTDSDAAVAAAVADATKDTVSKSAADAATQAAVAAATKGTISKTEADKATKTAVAAAQAAATKAATTVKKGDTFIVGKNIYQITNVSKKTAEFVGTYSKAKTITIPATAKNSKNSVSYKITTVAASAMKGNTTATKVTIGKNVTKINGSAFQSCTKLATVTIGKSVKTIGKSAFNGCTKLKKVTIKSTKLKTVKSKAFKIAKKAKVTVPSGKASSYKKLLKNAGLPSTATVK